MDKDKEMTAREVLDRHDREYSRKNMILTAVVTTGIMALAFYVLVMIGKHLFTK